MGLNKSFVKSYQKFLKYYSLNFGPQHLVACSVLRMILNLYGKAVKISNNITLKTNYRLLLSTAVTSEVPNSIPFYKQPELYVSIAIGLGVGFVLVGGVSVLCAYNLLPSVTVPFLSLLGLSNKNVVQNTSPIKQQALDALAHATYREKPHWVTDDTWFSSSSSQVSNTAAQRLTNNLPLNNSASDAVSSASNNLSTFPDLISATAQHLANDLPLNNSASINLFSDVAPTSKEAITPLSDAFMSSAADALAVAPSVEASTSVAINAAAAVATKVLTMAQPTSSSAVFESVVQSVSSPAISPEVIQSLSFSSQTDPNSLVDLISNTSSDFFTFYYISNFVLDVNSASEFNVLNLRNLSQIASEQLNLLLLNEKSYAVFSLVAMMPVVMASSVFTVHYLKYLAVENAPLLLKCYSIAKNLCNNFEQQLKYYMTNLNQVSISKLNSFAEAGVRLTIVINLLYKKNIETMSECKLKIQKLMAMLSEFISKVRSLH